MCQMLRVAFILTLVACAGESDTTAKLVGSRTCAGCHATEYAAWRRSQHAESMQEATPNTVLARFDESTFTSAGTTTKFFRRGNRYFVNTEGADGKSHDFEIRYTFGV